MAKTGYPGTFSTSYADVLSGVDITDDYIACRTGDYTYTLCQGDLTVSDGQLSISNGKCTTYDLHGYSVANSYGNYSYYPTIELTTESMTVNTNTCMVYSSATGYPSLNTDVVQTSYLKGIGLSVASVLVFLVLSDFVKKGVLQIRLKKRVSYD